MPALYELPPYSSGDYYYSAGGMGYTGQRQQSARSSSNHLSLISVKLHNINQIAEAFDYDLEASDDTKGLLLFDPINRGFTITCSSSYIERNALLAIGIEAQLSNQRDSVSMFSRAKELYIGTNADRE